MNKVFQWLKANKVLLSNAASMIGSTGITSLLGFAYWWLAARQFPPAAVGFASATISAMTLLGTFGVLGMGTLLVGELPRRQAGQKTSLISMALLLVGSVGLVLGLIFAFIAPFVSSSLQGLGTDPVSIFLFASGVCFTAITLVLDQALIGLLQGKLQLWRNTLFAVGKMLALFLAGLWFAKATGLAIYATWTIGNLVSLLALAAIALTKGVRPDRSFLSQFGILRKLGSAAMKHHALNLTLQAPTLLLPVLVTVALSAASNAWFYIAWNLSSIGNIVISSLTMALYAVSASQPQALARKMRLTLGVSFAACVLINIVFLFATPQVLGFFGHSYADQATWSLRILSIESFPFIIKAHYIAVRRIHGRMAPTALVTIATGALEVGGSALGVRLGGLTGLSLGWFSAMCIEIAFMFPAVYKAARLTTLSEQKIREELFAGDLEELEVAGNARRSGWRTDTLIQPVWVADTLTLAAIEVPKKVAATDFAFDDWVFEDVPQRPTIRLASFAWYSEAETMELPVHEK